MDADSLYGGKVAAHAPPSSQLVGGGGDIAVFELHALAQKHKLSHVPAARRFKRSVVLRVSEASLY